MSDIRDDKIPADRSLASAMRVMRDAAADRRDAAENLREQRRLRLEILADELEPVFGDIAEDDRQQFDFVISSGLQPRLWIDATTHVAMARDTRTYRLLMDTRLGRTVLAEDTRIDPMVDAVTRHVAMRVLERQRMLDGDVHPAAPPHSGLPPIVADAPKRPLSSWGEYASGVLLVILGMIAGAGILIAFLSDIFPQAGIGF